MLRASNNNSRNDDRRGAAGATIITTTTTTQTRTTIATTDEPRPLVLKRREVNELLNVVVNDKSTRLLLPLASSSKTVRLPPAVPVVTASKVLPLWPFQT